MSQNEQQKRNDDAWDEVSAAISAPEVELLELLIKDDSGDLNEAVEYLFGTAVHQGMLYDITLPVLRFCIRMLDQFSPEATEWGWYGSNWLGALSGTFPKIHTRYSCTRRTLPWWKPCLRSTPRKVANTIRGL